MPPDVSVVIPTRNRAGRLADQLASLRRQSIGRDRFEVIVVDDGSSDGTPALLRTAAGAGDLQLRVLRNDPARGPAAARNAGWRAAQARLIAFTDDDCVADPGWLAAGLARWEGDADAFVQGATEAMDEPRGPFSYAIEVAAPSPEYETCNIFYPRALLERIGGFDEVGFDGPQGEDTDLAWRARANGARPVFAPKARVAHAIIDLGPLGTLRRAWRWTPAVLPFARHPELRRARLVHGVFWNWTHYLVARALLAVPFTRRRWSWPLAWWLSQRLIRYELEKGRRQGDASLAVYWLAHDLVEVTAIVRGAIRYRTLVL